MRQVCLIFQRPIVAATLLASGLGVGCQGVIVPVGGDGQASRGGNDTTATRDGNASGSTANAGGANGASGTQNTGFGGATANPTLAQVADRYFPNDVSSDAGKRVFRLTRIQLDLTTKMLLPSALSTTAMSALPRDPLQTNYEYADNLSFNSANFTPFTNWVEAVAAAAKATPSVVIDCAASGNSSACLVEQSRRFVSKAFRGVLSDAGLSRYSDFFTASVASVGLPSATADLVSLVLSSPNYAFRDEVLTDSSGSLLPAEQLQNITYTLADAPPELVGLSSVTPSVYLQTPELTQKTIDQVLASPEARQKLLRFFIAWLEVKEPDEFTIASSAFPEFTPAVAAAVVSETQAFLARQLAKASPRMRDLTESTQSTVSSDAAFLYGKGVPSASGSLDLDPAQRLGLFTQPAVLASHSGPTTSRLVKRGVFFVRKVMCMPLGSPPPDIDTSIPVSAGDTERQRVESVTAQTKCAGCHALINPFGFALENYDAIGRWRTTDGGEPIDASTTVTFLDEGKLTTKSPVDALKAYTRSFRFQQCFARQLFRFYTGRDETAADDPVLHRMFFDFANDDEQDIVRLLHTLASAPTFSRRSEAP